MPAAAGPVWGGHCAVDRPRIPVLRPRGARRQPAPVVDSTQRAVAIRVAGASRGTYISAGQALEACGNVKCATRVVEEKYEIPADPAASFAERLADAKEIRQAYK